MLHLLFSSLLLGWGAAIPFGPINLEMMRRNLAVGTRFAVEFGLGVCSADATYVLVLSLGLLSLDRHVFLLKGITVLGSFVLMWFAYQAFRVKPIWDKKEEAQQKSAVKNWIEGYLLTLINPFTVLFWASVSTQLISITSAKISDLILTCIGVTCGTLSWVFVFNSILHVTRHKVTLPVIKILNWVGGVILFGFAIYGFYNVAHI